jgi:hypothetical protein
MIPWQAVEMKYLGQNLKITLDEIRTYPELTRVGSRYMVAGIFEKERTHKMPYSLS